MGADSRALGCSKRHESPLHCTLHSDGVQRHSVYKFQLIEYSALDLVSCDFVHINFTFESEEHLQAFY